MLCIGRNAFNEKSPEDQQRFKEEVNQYASQIARLVCERINSSINIEDLLLEKKEAPEQEDGEKIAGYIRQIANDENPLNENPSVAMIDETNPNYRLVTEIATVLYKAVTGQIPLINGKLADRKMLTYINPNLIALQRKGVTLNFSGPF